MARLERASRSLGDLPAGPRMGRRTGPSSESPCASGAGRIPEARNRLDRARDGGLHFRPETPRMGAETPILVGSA